MYSKNRAGIQVKAGSGSTSHLLYCGRRLGRDAIPGSDGQCGPNNGPQCPDCRGMTVGGNNITTTTSTMSLASLNLSAPQVSMVLHEFLCKFI
jgi:hypothetical protein